ncbi:MAG: hypothetical protein ACK5OC_19480 [Pirellula sp.]|jgi:hypothetical protein
MSNATLASIRAKRLFRRVKCFRFCEAASDLPEWGAAIGKSVSETDEHLIGWQPNHSFADRFNPSLNGTRFLVLTDKAIYDVWENSFVRYGYSQMRGVAWDDEKGNLNMGTTLRIVNVDRKTSMLPVNFCDDSGASVFTIWRYLIGIITDNNRSSPNKNAP